MTKSDESILRLPAAPRISCHRDMALMNRLASGTGIKKGSQNPLPGR
jgi:hypothetical protein